MKTSMLTALLLLPLTCQAQVTLSTGYTVIRDPVPVVELAYEAKPIQLAVTVNPHQLAAQALYIYDLKRLRFGVGGVYLQHTDWMNGSHANFSLMLSYRLSESMSLTYRHWSNADTKIGR